MITNIWMNKYRYNVEVVPAVNALQNVHIEKFINSQALDQDAVDNLLEFPYWAVYYQITEEGFGNPNIVVSKHEHVAHNKACFSIFLNRNVNQAS